MTKIFITGATGLIGTRLTKRLVEEGHEVAGFTTSERGKEKLERLNAKAYIGDILKADTIDAKQLVTFVLKLSLIKLQI